MAQSATLERWFAEFGARLRRMIARRLSCRAGARRDADDVLQEVFLQAVNRWESFNRSGITPYGWLYRLTLDVICDDHDYQHRHLRDIRLEQPFPDRSSVQMVLGLVGTGTSPSQAAARNEQAVLLHQRVTETLELLPAVDKDLLCMRHHDELKLNEIAQVLGIQPDAARQRYARARLQLRKLWIERYGEGAALA